MTVLHSPTPVNAADAETAVPNSVGLLLSSARRALPQPLSLQDVAKQLNLREEVVQWIEQDAFDQLPPILFVQGYVRAYADLVGLPAEPLLQQLAQCYPQSDDRHREELVMPIKMPKIRSYHQRTQGKKRRMALFVAGLVVLGGVIIYQVFVDGVGSSNSLSGKIQQFLPASSQSSVPLNHH